MKKSSVRIKPILFFILILASFLLILILTKVKLFPKDDPWKEFKDLLYQKETIVHGIQEEKRAYMIISREGRKDYGDLLVIFDKSAKGNWDRSYENDFKDLKPWKILIADLDGDGTIEIITSVCKTTHFDEIEKNRMFIFNYDDEKLSKKWTGSQIAGTWNAFIAGDLVDIPGEELIFISESENKNERVRVYYWFDFGFFLLAESKDYEDIISLSIVEENRMKMVYRKQGREEVVTLMIKDGTIAEITKEQ